MDSIHQDETAAEVMGIDVVRTKLFAFGLGALIAGLAGALYAHQATFMDSTTFNIMLAVEILMFVVVGGGSTYWGPLLGADLLTLLPEFLRTLARMAGIAAGRPGRISIPTKQIYDFLHEFLDFENAKRLIVYGIILIVMMILRPDGLLTRDALRRFSWLGKPAAAEAAACLSVCLVDRGPDQALRRLLCAERSAHAGRAGRDPCADRPERRRQDHVLQSRHRRAAPPTPAASCSRARS